MKHLLITSAAVAILLAAVGAAGAQVRPVTVRSACAADARRLCVDGTASKVQFQQCLRSHRGQLSADCNAAIAAAKATRAQRRAAAAANLQPGSN